MNLARENARLDERNGLWPLCTNFFSSFSLWLLATKQTNEQRSQMNFCSLFNNNSSDIVWNMSTIYKQTLEIESNTVPLKRTPIYISPCFAHNQMVDCMVSLSRTLKLAQ